MFEIEDNKFMEIGNPKLEIPLPNTSYWYWLSKNLELLLQKHSIPIVLSNNIYTIYLLETYTLRSSSEVVTIN